VPANLKDIRKRIITIDKTQQITRAMRMVSAAKLSRAIHAVVAARPFAAKMREVLGAVAAGIDPDAHPLLVGRDPVRKLDVVVFSSDRGLCGAFNANIIKRAERMIVRRQPELESVALVPVGRKGGDYFRRHRYGDVPRVWSGVGTVTQPLAQEIAEFLIERYRSGETDQTVLVYSEFMSALTQRPTDHVLLPVRPESTASEVRYDMEPPADRLCELLVPRAVEFAVFRALLENQAGEHGARMTAMENATNNTEELIRTLTLDYNKARQAAITAELVEIVSGAEAL
jgi:F-type H+-transporting ATPase subunit gamma